MVNVYGDWMAHPALAIFLIVGATAAFGYWIWTSRKRAWARTHLAEAAEASVTDATTPLVEGADVVLFGTVQHLDEHDVAVKVSVKQHGSESESSGGWSYSWKEVNRDIVVAPFLLRLPSGESVRVEPPMNVDVADDLDQRVWIRHDERVLSAELVPDEQIYARGRLQRSDVARPASGYRETAWGWALVPRDGQMLLSSEPMGRGFRERAVFHHRAATWAMWFLIGLQLTLLPFYRRAFLGETMEMRVVEMDTRTTVDDDGDVTETDWVRVENTRLRGLREIARDNRFELARGDRVWVRYASDSNWELGAYPTIHALHGLLLLCVTVIFGFVLANRRVHTRPWFRRPVNESGSGRLPSFTPPSQ